MSAVATAIVGTAVIGGVASDQASKRGQRAIDRASDASIAAQEDAQQQFIDRTQPYSDLGLSVAPEIQSLLGIRAPSSELSGLRSELGALDSQIAAGPQVTRKKKKRGGLLGGAVGGLVGGLGGDPITGSILGAAGSSGGGTTVGPFDLAGLTARRDELQGRISALDTAEQTAFDQRQPAGLDEINPLVNFLRDQGFNDIQESAAARGRLGAGGTLKDLTKFNTDLTATVVPQLQQQRFNQLFNILGLGSNASTGQGTAALNTASSVGNILTNQGNSQANTAIARGQNTQNLLGNLSSAFGAYQGGAFGTRPPQQNFVDAPNPNQFQGFA